MGREAKGLFIEEKWAKVPKKLKDKGQNPPLIELGFDSPFPAKLRPIRRDLFIWPPIRLGFFLATSSREAFLREFV